MNKFFEQLKYTFLYELIYPIIQILQTLDWFLKSKHKHTPQLIKQEIIKSHAKKYKLPILIETGTYLGTTVNANKNIFSRIYSIELDKKLYNRAKNKFKKFKNIEIIHGDSSVILPKMIQKITKPCLFWLDAHYSKGITTKGAKETPVWEELASILRHKIKHHVILIDDADTFIGKNDYPTIGKIKKVMLKENNYYNIEINYNIIIITPRHLSK
ncbi:hypothetical protein A3H81_01610 [Candidatus Daviesbacteria bacterium RIFCSPLOWO2_02_FULL_38_18]|uniref:Methyltransferase, FkbM family n=1 Tax=Candidatus Daviesbacteria bacterium GW2011_GWF2_38_6 TaxID=1618432 RepID=A0A0G0KHV2_9BACT|nr:MAG: Methyltransferase, FkbM family [Candidatus Daviesbacteria bacterium GW2011_GWF2_38_6]OGE28880.1 MAG: hypothetical protein A2772_01455 [Candidatus Daviesbacteria bacterium RIFCSPHIGHO2_01_FULL_38_8b]OGE67927.1 MAG: hypothetical protein A3H81_01610 [Candidatus Daviesbacteria bacterium RIFCSPLOWO2_02_FULL_38_18]OGE73340.1 MAG: hypothetical protein A3H18_04750 [Candidatus Daviesbacteria bacterium RIFCSPLOWO2_12_FULL_38_10]HCB22834.1 hypothetical protein [Candidatus Daviesbacteria bacterium]